MDPNLDHNNQQICPVVNSAPAVDSIGSLITLDLLKHNRETTAFASAGGA
jgi:hypothetical protein